MSQGEGGGQPPKYTDERLKAILHSISRRVPYEFAAYANGICEKTLYKWINQGKADLTEGNETKLAKFVQDLKKIEHDLIARHSDKISENVERWQADAWLLERRFWKHYGANVQQKDLDERVSKLEDDKGK